MVNNSEQIVKLLNFRTKDDFYFIQILKRKKEHPELGSNSHVVKTYYIKSIDDFDFHFPEMKCLADFHNARVCINLNRRSFEKMAFHTMRKVADQIMNKDFKSVRAAYNSVCGEYSQETDKIWIIDLDGEDTKKLTEISNFIRYLKPFDFINFNTGEIKEKIVATLSTKNGLHLLTHPLDVQEFKKKYSDIEIHKNNPTIIYIP